MKFKQALRKHHDEHGATLIEALVAILVLSLGLLGMAGLQLNALSFQKSSWSTHRIAELTGDISERIRANPTGASNGNYVYTATYSTAKTATTTTNLCRSSGSDCTTAQIATDDLHDWLIKAQTALPSGAATITGDSMNGYVVTAMYQDKEFVDPTTGAPQSATTCTAALAGIAWRTCCPATASAPAGVRCYRSNIIP